MPERNDLLSVLAELAAIHSTAAALAQRAYTLAIEAEASTTGSDQVRSAASSRNGELTISSVTFSVEWRGRQCALGPSLLFRLIHRIARHPGRYYAFDVLMSEVWRGRCSDNAVHASLKRLRRALVEAGMIELAAAVRTRGRCCGLFLDMEDA